jgi:hypothetical protein
MDIEYLGFQPLLVHLVPSPRVPGVIVCINFSLREYEYICLGGEKYINLFQVRLSSAITASSKHPFLWILELHVYNLIAKDDYTMYYGKC